MKRIIYIIFFFLLIESCAPIKIACVGDSITYGDGIKGRDSLAYPQQMQSLLGKKYKIKNFGVNGATMLKSGNKPYWNQLEYLQVLKFKPKIVILMLGTNDSKPINWDNFKNNFKIDYKNMIEQFQQLKSKPKIFLGLPPPVYIDKWGIRKKIVEEEIIDIIKTVRKEKGLTSIDFYTILSDLDSAFSDGIHPNKTGAKRMAHLAVSKILTTE